MDLNVHVKGDTPQEILSKLAQYLSQSVGATDVEGLKKAAENVPGVTAQGGDGGGPG